MIRLVLLGALLFAPAQEAPYHCVECSEIEPDGWYTFVPGETFPFIPDEFAILPYPGEDPDDWIDWDPFICGGWDLAVESD